jgi:hypothetical protein
MVSVIALNAVDSSSDRVKPKTVKFDAALISTQH